MISTICTQHQAAGFGYPLSWMLLLPASYHIPGIATRRFAATQTEKSLA